MTPEAQRIAIAEACGQQPVFVCFEHGEVSSDRVRRGESGALYCPWCRHQLVFDECPDYLNDLNAMHDAEKCLRPVEFEVYIGTLRRLFIAKDNAHCATAAQRAEAFLRTLNLWKEDA